MRNKVTLESLPSDADLQQMTTEELVSEFQDGLGISENGIKRAANALHYLRIREYDVSELGCNVFLNWLDMVYSGRLLPGVVARYMGDRAVVNAASRMKIEDQKRLADDSKIPVVIKEGNQYTHCLKPVSVALKEDRKQVLGPNGLFTMPEQRAMFDVRPRNVKKNRTNHIGPMKLDYERLGVDVPSRSFIALRDLKTAVRLLRAAEEAAG